jgi:hypothetical protein
LYIERSSTKVDSEYGYFIGGLSYSVLQFLLADWPNHKPKPRKVYARVYQRLGLLACQRLENDLFRRNGKKFANGGTTSMLAI